MEVEMGVRGDGARRLKARWAVRAASDDAGRERIVVRWALAELGHARVLRGG
ncbi:hypothetical protein KZZ52_29840 [Dactylosporangium sp. AC04546]|uniref:hypothetical protein n=1 Tax=Dactylosporangium sp. AC04546 TaxID=2862460 RepID=UPI001EDF67C6|nr:hypothetical protein [Dactylosporangium sp. AC04546]WVK78198.1 hypothetical protein KZZ52_29840 [Dactylosporangium sp. AC04546]